MDTAPPKIYDIQLVINSIDFGGSPAKVRPNKGVSESDG
jgi:hypothetical protein